VADGDDVRDLVPDDARIRLVHIEEGCLIGEKRNFGIGLSGGEVIAHWDDDDYSASERLSDQVKRLQESGKSVTAYCSMGFTDGSSWWRYNGTPNFSQLGTSLCYRRSFWEANPFPLIQIGEDLMFADAARLVNQFISVAAGPLMAATIHAGNTSRRFLTEDPWLPMHDFAGIPNWP
jgi:hypothetical protein